MGTTEDKEYHYPELLCFFETDNEEQKQYCIKIKDNFRYEEPIRFKIKSSPDYKFKISFRLNGKTHLIQDIFNDSEVALNESLGKMYTLLENEASKKKKYHYPELLCFFETDNESQKSYCIKLKDNIRYEKPIRFEIKAGPAIQFKITFRLLNGKTYLIQDFFDDSDETLKESLNKIYTLLDGGDISEKSNKNNKSKETKKDKKEIKTNKNNIL